MFYISVKVEVDNFSSFKEIVSVKFKKCLFLNLYNIKANKHVAILQFVDINYVLIIYK
jgi:hypothetical protein